MLRRAWIDGTRRTSWERIGKLQIGNGRHSGHFRASPGVRLCEPLGYYDAKDTIALESQGFAKPHPWACISSLDRLHQGYPWHQFTDTFCRSLVIFLGDLGDIAVRLN